MSGRDVIWQEVISHWHDSPLFGFGAQADRLFETNAQNALLYALLSAGLVGASFFVIAILASWRALFSVVSKLRRLPPRERTMVEITGAILVFSTLRSYPENQAAVFSVDLLLQYPAMIYLVVIASRMKDSHRRDRRQTMRVANERQLV